MAHTGIFMESGSGGVLNDVVIYGGLHGVELGNQQYSMRNLTFIGSAVGIKQLWNWGWTYKSLNFIDCGIGIDAGSVDVGGMTLLDSTFTNVSRAIITSRCPANNTGQNSLVMQGVRFVGVPIVLEGPDGHVYLAGTSDGSVYEPGYAMVGPVRDPAHRPLPLTLVHPRAISTCRQVHSRTTAAILYGFLECRT